MEGSGSFLGAGCKAKGKHRGCLWNRKQKKKVLSVVFFFSPVSDVRDGSSMLREETAGEENVGGTEERGAQGKRGPRGGQGWAGG